MGTNATATERIGKSTAQTMHRGLWGLFLVVSALLSVLPRNHAVFTSLLWLDIGVVAALMLWFVLLPLTRRVTQRSTEARLVRDMRSYLSHLDVDPTPASATPAPKLEALVVENTVVEGNKETSSAGVEIEGFRDALQSKLPESDLVIFDVMPVSSVEEPMQSNKWDRMFARLLVRVELNET